MDAAGARSAMPRGVADAAAIRCWAAVIGAKDEAEIRRIRAEIGLSPRWPSRCLSGKQKAAGHVQPPISCVALKARHPSRRLLLLLRFLFLCFLRHSGAPVLKFENAAETDSHKNIPCA